MPTERARGRVRFGIAGQLKLPEARLYYYKARVYDPVMGRFMQTDPIGSVGDLNLYAYVNGDPVNKSDPTGLLPPDSSHNPEDMGGLGFDQFGGDDGVTSIWEIMSIVMDVIKGFPLDGDMQLTQADPAVNQGEGGFGPDKRDGRGHKGNDFVAPVGPNAKSVGNGRVVRADGRDPKFGNQIVMYLGRGVYVQYAHLSQLNVKRGAMVTTGTRIGLTGVSGNAIGSSQPHLHFEIRLTPGGVAANGIYGGRLSNGYEYLVDPWLVFTCLGIR